MTYELIKRAESIVKEIDGLNAVLEDLKSKRASVVIALSSGSTFKFNSFDMDAAMLKEFNDMAMALVAKRIADNKRLIENIK